MRPLKIRFIEPRVAPRGGTGHRDVPISGPIVLATILHRWVPDCLVYSELVTQVRWADVYDSNIVFISVNTHNATRAYRLAERIRRNSTCMIVMGGMHASLNYEEAVLYCDYVLVGEADESIVELVRAYPDRERIADIRGLARRVDGEPLVTGARPPPVDIDVIPNRHLVYGYARHAKLNPMFLPLVHGSRGCVYDCAFCGIVRHFGRRVRHRSPRNVVDDIEQAIAFHQHPITRAMQVRVLWITDDNFAHDRAWAVEVLEEIIRRGIDYAFVIQARVEIGADRALLRLMKRAGFVELFIGFESIEQANLDDFGKRSSLDKIRECITAVHGEGLGIHALFVVGGDSDRLGVGRKIARFVADNRINGALVQSLYPIPRTALYERLASEKRLLPVGWHHYVGDVVHRPKHLEPSELQREIMIASRSIYSGSRLAHALMRYPPPMKWFFVGEFIWQLEERRQMRKHIATLRRLEARTRTNPPVDAPTT